MFDGSRPDAGVRLRSVRTETDRGTYHVSRLLTRLYYFLTLAVRLHAVAIVIAIVIAIAIAMARPDDPSILQMLAEFFSRMGYGYPYPILPVADFLEGKSA